jgi:putative ABC transport system ATP-binding protein
MSAVIEITGVTKDYGQNSVITHALRGINLSIEQGEFTVMAGPSGSGKSTLLNVIGGLDRPSSGFVKVEGRNTVDLSRTEMTRLRRDRIGFIFQSYNLVPVLTVIENAEYVMMLQGTPAAKRRERVCAILKEVGLEGMENRFPRELSGGQQQRVAIARAIAPQPAIILADEPTANVDSKTARNLLDIMRRLNSEQQATFLISTHDPRVMKLARRMIYLTDGQVHSDGPPGKNAGEEM